MAEREEETSDVEIDGIELDEDCLVRVGRAGAGRAGADALNPAQKETRESRLSTKDQWTERLAVVDAHLCPLMDNFVLRQIFGRSEEENALVFDHISPEQAELLRKQDTPVSILRTTKTVTPVSILRATKTVFPQHAIVVSVK